MNPLILDQIVHQHLDDRHREAARRSAARRSAARRSGAVGGGGAFRRRAGWALVNIGLRLAVRSADA